MNKTYKLSALWMMCLVFLGCLSFSACDNGDEEDTNQYKGGISLNVFGPCPVARGGELRFLGSGMDRVQSVTIPGCGEITDIEVVNEKEIRVTVPQTAEVGYIVLKTPSGEITTKTRITYSEPIGVETIAPNPVKPGEVLVIKGEYLNLIKEVIFFEEVAVAEDDFVAHSRKEIQVRVPMTAKSGDITLADALSEDKEAMRNLIPVKGLEVVLPSVEAPLDLSAKKPGDEIVVKGKDLDLVEVVRMPNGDEVEFAYDRTEEAGETITFTLPANASDGAVVMIPASGVEVAIANIGMALPAEVKAVPAEGLRAGDVITLTGVNMELVTDILFPGVEGAVEPDSKSATELKATMPAAAVSGDLLLNTASGASIPVAIATQKPEFMGFASDAVSLGNEVTIQGKNLDLVVKVVYTGGAEVEVAPASATELTIAMPTTCTESGALTLVMANGESVETGELTINAPEFCYIPVLPGEDEELKGGEVLSLKVENADKLQGVKVNDKEVQYILTPNGDLLINVPQMAGRGTKVTLLSSNGSIDYFIDFIPATEIENVVMDQMHDLGVWADEASGGAFRLYKKDLTEAGFAPGAKLRFYVSIYATTQIQINNANWGQYTMLEYGANETAKMVELDVTQDLYDEIMNTNDGWSDTGFVIQGKGCVISRVSVWYKMSLETTIWTGEAVCDGWGNQPTLLSDGGKELIEAGAKVGSTIRFYVTPMAAEWKLQIVEGHWGPTWLDLTFESYDLAANGGAIALVITQDMWNAITTVQYWGGTFLGNGDKSIITKITVE